MRLGFVKRENVFLWDLCENILVAACGGTKIKAGAVEKGDGIVGCEADARCATKRKRN